jgi:pyrroline-5-carboxylate reductase
MREALLPLGPTLRERQPLLISIAAGVTIDSMTTWIGGQPAIVRVMPNTPALVGAGASGLFANEAVSNTQREVAQSIMQAVGVSVWVSREALIDTVTAVSGSGPAYFFYLMEAIEAAGLAGGLAPDIARRLTLQTALGAAKLAIASDEPVAELRRRVTSPGGTTERAIQFLESAGASETIQRAVDAARIRSEELAQLGQED